MQQDGAAAISARARLRWAGARFIYYKKLVIVARISFVLAFLSKIKYVMINIKFCATDQGQRDRVHSPRANAEMSKRCAVSRKTHKFRWKRLQGWLHGRSENYCQEMQLFGRKWQNLGATAKKVNKSSVPWPTTRNVFDNFWAWRNKIDKIKNTILSP